MPTTGIPTILSKASFFKVVKNQNYMVKGLSVLDLTIPSFIDPSERALKNTV